MLKMLGNANQLQLFIFTGVFFRLGTFTPVGTNMKDTLQHIAHANIQRLN